MPLQSTQEIISGAYTDAQWTARKGFVDTITDLCESEGIAIKWLSDYWVAKIEKHGQVKYIVSYGFPLNNVGAVEVARDKVATFEVLSRRDIPVVPHWLAFFGENASGRDINQLAATAQRLTAFPMVVKPCTESMGRNVYRVATNSDLVAKLKYLSAHYTTATICPFEVAEFEYRVIVLDGQTRIAFRKNRARDPLGQLTEWRHNLNLGAIPSRVADPALQRHLANLAHQAMTTLGLRYAAVDIIESQDGLKVMEVNAGFTMLHLGKDPVFQDAVRDCYLAALRGSFDRN